MNNSLLPLKKLIQSFCQKFWRYTQYSKRKFLSSLSSPTSIWIETGTFRGDTTILLSQVSCNVHTIEPVDSFYGDAKLRLAHLSNIICYHGTSEVLFEKVLMDVLAGGAGKEFSPLCIFLDGHFSGGHTYEGFSHTPVRHELLVLSKHITIDFHGIIAIDDARLFKDAPGTYPAKSEIEAWAKSHGLSCSVHHDMFVIKNV